MSPKILLNHRNIKIFHSPHACHKYIRSEPGCTGLDLTSSKILNCLWKYGVRSPHHIFVNRRQRRLRREITVVRVGNWWWVWRRRRRQSCRPSQESLRHIIELSLSHVTSHACLAALIWRKGECAGQGILTINLSSQFSTAYIQWLWTVVCHLLDYILVTWLRNIATSQWLVMSTQGRSHRCFNRLWVCYNLRTPSSLFEHADGNCI